MTFHLGIKNSIKEKLREFKGEGSWSDAVESAVEKAKKCSVKEQAGKEKIEKEQEEIEEK